MHSVPSIHETMTTTPHVIHSEASSIDSSVLRNRTTALRNRKRRMRRKEGRIIKEEEIINQPPKQTFKKGQKYDVSRFLSSPERDYLIRNNGAEVKIKDHLSGKYVLLYFWLLTKGITPEYTSCSLSFDLRDTYRLQDNFEVVFIALGNNRDAFIESFSEMPWLAIPHVDEEARDFFVKFFYIRCPELGTPLFFAPCGTVMLYESKFEAAMKVFGPEGFPFDDKTILKIEQEGCALWDELFVKNSEPSLTRLFGEHVISPEGYKVPTSELEGKYLGLCFFEGSVSCYEQAVKLLEIWQLLKVRRRSKEFEFVFINKSSLNLSFSKLKFELLFGFSIPWYSTLVDSRHLCRVFRHSQLNLRGDAGVFVILGPDMYQSLNYFGLEIFKEFGYEAYPFTMQAAVRAAKSKQKAKLVLGELLSPSTRLLRRGLGSACDKEETTTISELAGKRVLLLFASHYMYVSASTRSLFFRELEMLYNMNKGTTEEFEIIYISLNYMATLPMETLRRMPRWLHHPWVPGFGASLVRKVFDIFPYDLAVAAFGPDGHLETKESNLIQKKKCNWKYPFIESDMDEEVYRELIHKHKWDLQHLLLVCSTE